MRQRPLSVLVLLGLAAAASCHTAASVPLSPCPAPPTAGDDGPASRPVPARSSEAPPPLLIRGATVWTAAGAVLDHADVLVVDGTISAVAPNLAAPAGARVIEAAGKHLTPGLIDPHSHLGVYPVPNLRGNEDGNEVAKPISPAARAEDALWPQDPGISLALAAGVTTALVVPGSANLVGGEGVTIKLIPGRSIDDLRFPGAPPTLKMACGENPKRVYGEKGGPYTRMGSVARVRELMQAAREYERSWERHRKALAEWQEKRCRGGDRKKKEDSLPPAPPKRDLALETMVKVLEGKILVQWHCYRADEMQLLLDVAHEFGFHIQAFHHAVEAYKLRDALRRSRTGVVTWVNWWGFKVEALDAIPEAAGLLSADGVTTAMHSDSPVVIQRLNQEAALAYYRARDLGLRLTEDDAIKLVTLNPARILGIDRFVGSIEPGKMADLVLWDGSPLSVYTRTEKVFVDGRLRYDRRSREGRRPTDFELALVPRPAPIEEPGPERPAALDPSWTAAALVRPQPPAAGGRPVAIVGGTVYPMTGPPIARGTVLLRGDRVAAVGANVAVPADATVIDATGRIVTPGLVAAETTLGLVDISMEQEASDEPRDGPRPHPVRASARAWDALNPDSAAVPVTRLGGFTTAVTRLYGGLVSGQAGAFDLAGRSPAQDALVAPVAVDANLGAAGARAAEGSRALALAELRRLLDDARLFARSRAAVEARRFRDLAAPVSELAALVPVIERKVPLVVTVNRAADILAALRLAEEEKIRLVLGDAAEGWQVADAIARARVPVLVEVDHNLPETYDALGGRYDNAARLHRAGVPVALSAGGDAHDVRSLRQLAGIAAAWGLPRTAALAAITSTPAAIFGLGDRGILAPGARANVVVWSGDPLELKTHVERLVIGGKLVPLESRQTKLRDRYRSLHR